MRLDSKDFDKALQVLGYSVDRIRNTLSGVPAPVAQKRLEKLKEEIKKEYRRQTHTLHPDRGGDESTFKLVNAAMDLVEKLRVVQHKTPPPQTVVVQFGFGVPATVTTGSVFTASATSTGFRMTFTNGRGGRTGGF